MQIRHGHRPVDIERLTTINDTCFKGLERPPHSDFKAMLSTTEVWLAESDVTTLGKDGKNNFIIGYIIVNRQYDAYLWQVAVDPHYQHRGVAGNLIREAELWCQSRGDKSMRLHVKNDNPSQKLYFDRGYRVYDFSRDYYGPGTVALMMKKAL